MGIKFECFCGQPIEVNEDGIGQEVYCPSCNVKLVVTGNQPKNKPKPPTFFSRLGDRIEKLFESLVPVVELVAKVLTILFFIALGLGIVVSFSSQITVATNVLLFAIFVVLLCEKNK